MKKIITFISDTHTQHRKLTNDLPGGDILIHSGDIMGSGYYPSEVKDFCEWFNNIDNYKHKIFIAGNHDRLAENLPDVFNNIVNSFDKITYLQDSHINIDGIKIYGSPWQPEFYSWAFNLPRGKELKEKWALIPDDTDILVTHGPPLHMLDYVYQSMTNVGCHDLLSRIYEINIKINVFGHIHQGYGTKTFEGVEYINASNLNESYMYRNKPITIEYNEGKIKYK